VKRLLLVFVLALWAALPGSARAHDAYDDTQSHPLRLAAYALHPAGYALEWLVMRPIHFVVSNPSLEPVFGHTAHEPSFGGYEAYEPVSDDE
jgi:hypothetical protein